MEAHYRDCVRYHGNQLVSCAIFLLAAVAYMLQLWTVFSEPNTLGLQLSSAVFGALTLIFFVLYCLRKQIHLGRLINFTSVYLLTLMTLLISWRLSVLAGANYANIAYLIAFALKMINLGLCLYHDIDTFSAQTTLRKIRGHECQLLFIRMFIGYNLVPHFCEKLFAGPIPRQADITAFQNLHVPHAFSMVIVAGVIELLGCYAIACGFLTRLAAVCMFAYLMIATYLGHHFALGFIWANQGGGWEYPVLWSVLILSFALFGSSGFSIDEVLKHRFNLPRWIHCLMG